MRAHFAFTSNAVASHAADALRVVVVSSAPLVRSGLRTILGAFDDLDVTEADPTRLRVLNADVMICDGTVPDVDVPALVLVCDGAGAAEALASGAGSSVRHSATVGDDLLYAAVVIRHQGAVVGVSRVALSLRGRPLRRT